MPCIKQVSGDHRPKDHEAFISNGIFKLTILFCTQCYDEFEISNAVFRAARIVIAEFEGSSSKIQNDDVFSMNISNMQFLTYDGL